MSPQELIEALLELENVESVEITAKVSPIIKKQSTGEVDDAFNDIRERAHTKEEVRDVAQGGWSYLGMVDVIGDYRIKDSFVLSTTHEPQ